MLKIKERKMSLIKSHKVNKVVGRLVLLISLSALMNSFYSQDELSLKSSLEVALKQNFDILSTEKAVEVNQIQNTWGQDGRFPTVTIGATQGNNISDQSKNPTSSHNITINLFLILLLIPLPLISLLLFIILNPLNKSNSIT